MSDLPEGFRWRVKRDYDEQDVLWLMLQKRHRFGFWTTKHWKYISIKSCFTYDSDVSKLLEKSKVEAWSEYSKNCLIEEAIKDVVRQHSD